ncbi:MAG: phosphoribosylglycinamide formyltransferase [Candidatus Omnitrophica bacterium]|nr:phosphoribosylglycinamide formyltransferase [Candidatus Omnitrophota bacterium]
MKSGSNGIPAIAVFCSGQGTNLQAIILALRSGRLRARIAAVVCDQPKAFALVRARRAGLETILVERSSYNSRAAFEQAILDRLAPFNVRLVCLAGFMRILSPGFIRRFPNRILNIHPALLPAFPGGRAVRDALAWGAKVTGVTVHLIDEQVDHGPILLQEAVDIRARETEASLLARLHRLEHRLYPRAITLMLSGRVRVAGRRITLR